MTRSITLERFLRFGFSIFKDQDTRDYDLTFSKHKRFLMGLEEKGEISEKIFNTIELKVK